MARPKTTLNEIMGKNGETKTISLSNLHEYLGEKMPSLEYHPMGRVRLIRALAMRFGPGYRNLPGVSALLKEFDDNAKTEIIAQKIKNASRRS